MAYLHNFESLEIFASLSYTFNQYGESYKIGADNLVQL
jgi:hypothetical protein